MVIMVLMMIMVLMVIMVVMMEADLKAKVIGGYNSKKCLRGQDENDILEAPTKVFLVCVPCLINR